MRARLAAHQPHPDPITVDVLIAIVLTLLAEAGVLLGKTP